MTRTATRLESGGRDEDRLLVEHVGQRTLIVVADGAGGTSRGAGAAELTCSMALAAFRQMSSSADSWIATVAGIDRELLRTGHGGQCTAVILESVRDTSRGASVGASEAGALGSPGVVELTSQQRRK